MCRRTPVRAASAAVRSISDVVTLNGEHGANATCLALAAGTGYVAAGISGSRLRKVN